MAEPREDDPVQSERLVERHRRHLRPVGPRLRTHAPPGATSALHTHPLWTRMAEGYRREGRPLPEEGDGMALFRNAVTYFTE